MSLNFSEISIQLLTLFAVIGIGSALGRLKLRGVGLGSAAVFIVGIIAGHLGLSVPNGLQSFGLAIFVAAIGFSAGPSFLPSIKRSGGAFLVLCLAVSLSGAVGCRLLIALAHIDAPLAVGVMTGSFTSSPGFAAAREVVTGGKASLVAAGYGIAYPIGVIAKVLLVQLVPKMFRADLEKEKSKIAVPAKVKSTTGEAKLGIIPFSFAVILGIVLGSVELKLHSSAEFSPGITGGVLLISLAFGHIGKLGSVSILPESYMLKSLKQLGLLIFLACSGVEGGGVIATVLADYGVLLIAYALVLVIIPFAIGVIVFKLLKLQLLGGLGAMTGCMTCTPALAMLSQTAKTDDVAAFYASCYPIALLNMVIIVQFLL